MFEGSQPLRLGAAAGEFVVGSCIVVGEACIRGLRDAADTCVVLVVGIAGGAYAPEAGVLRECTGE